MENFTVLEFLDKASKDTGNHYRTGLGEVDQATIVIFLLTPLASAKNRKREMLSKLLDAGVSSFDEYRGYANRAASTSLKALFGFAMKLKLMAPDDLEAFLVRNPEDHKKMSKEKDYVRVFAHELIRGFTNSSFYSTVLEFTSEIEEVRKEKEKVTFLPKEFFKSFLGEKAQFLFDLVSGVGFAVQEEDFWFCVVRSKTPLQDLEEEIRVWDEISSLSKDLDALGGEHRQKVILNYAIPGIRPRMKLSACVWWNDPSRDHGGHDDE
jgi:hypothetical protein